MLSISARTQAKPAATVAFALLTILAAPTSLLAQDADQHDTNARLLACDSIADPMEKLACFDTVVKSLGQGSGVPRAAPVEPAATSDAVRTPVRPIANPSTKTTSMASSAPSATAAPVAATAPVAAKAPTANSAPATAPGTSAAAATAPDAASGRTAKPDASQEVAASNETPMSMEDSFGIESVKSDEAEKEEINRANELKSIKATIVESWPTIDGRFEARLDNGQVWRETALTRTSRLPKAGSSVVISRGRLGSFRMKIGNNNRLAGVRRTK